MATAQSNTAALINTHGFKGPTATTRDVMVWIKLSHFHWKWPQSLVTFAVEWFKINQHPLGQDCCCLPYDWNISVNFKQRIFTRYRETHTVKRTKTDILLGQVMSGPRWAHCSAAVRSCLCPGCGAGDVRPCLPAPRLTGAHRSRSTNSSSGAHPDPKPNTPTGQPGTSSTQLTHI